MKTQKSNHTQKSRRGVKTREMPNRVEPSAVDVASKQRSSDATHSEDHIQQDNNSLKRNKTIDKANTKVNARKKVGCSDDLTARTKAHMVHSHAEKVSVFSPVKSSNHTQLASSIQGDNISKDHIRKNMLNNLQGKKKRTILYLDEAATKSRGVKHGPLIGKKGITLPVETSNSYLQDDDLDNVKGRTVKDVNHISSDIQQEMEKDTEEIFNKMDEIFEEYFGKMCPDFDPNCIQCKVSLVYNNFKKQIWDEFIKK